jgi:uncharacterized protein (DUF58 family)
VASRPKTDLFKGENRLERNRIVFLLWVFLLIAAVGTGREPFYNLWYLVTALLAFSFLWAWTGVRWVRVERHSRTTRSQVGKMAEERLVVENLSWLPKLWLEVRDHSTLPNHHISWVINSLGARKTYARSVQTRCMQRGRFALGPLTLNSGDPFGLFKQSHELEQPAEASFIVYPATVDVPGFAPMLGFLPGGETTTRRTAYVTTNVSGVRDYAPGDSFNRIHWPSTARTGRLISKEFELDPTADVWLFLDLERNVNIEPAWSDTVAEKSMRMPWEISPKLELLPSTVEYGVTIVASLGKHFIERDRAVGFISYCPRREIIPADRGERQLTKILETLSVVHADGHIPLSEVITAEGKHLNRNTTAIVITPTDDNYWIAAARDIKQRGVRVVAVLMECRSFGSLRSNEDLITELAISGITSYLVREGDDLSQALARPYGQAIPSIARQ